MDMDTHEESGHTLQQIPCLRRVEKREVQGHGWLDKRGKRQRVSLQRIFVLGPTDCAKEWGVRLVHLGSALILTTHRAMHKQTQAHRHTDTRVHMLWLNIRSCR